MRIFARILAVAAGALLLAAASAQDGVSQPGKETVQKSGDEKSGDKKSGDKVNELQQERIATLKSMAEMESTLHRIGKSPPEAVLEAKVLVCEAELDAAENESDRISVLKSLVEVLKELEETAKARKRAAEATEVPVLKAKARRLEAEIRLARLETKAQGQAKKAEPGHENIVVACPQVKDVAITQPFAGQICARRHIDIRSLQSGYLEKIDIKEGQAVKHGERLFQIAPLRFQAKLDAELAEVESAALNLANAEKLLPKMYASENDVALLRAKLAGAQAKAKLAQAELDLTVVRAPFDGMIDRLYEQQGSLVTERNILTTLSDNSAMWVYFNVPESSYLRYMSNLAKDQEAEVDLVLADGRMFPQKGKIAAMEAQFDEKTLQIPFRADFPNPDGLLRHGMAGKVLIHRTLKSALVIPQRATFEIDGRRYVYVIDKEGVAHQRRIGIERALAEEFVVEQGIDVNDRIVLEGVRQIQDGKKLPDEIHQR